MPQSGMLVSMMGDEPESAPKKWPNGLKRARVKRGLTQPQAAEALVMSFGGYVKIEQGCRGMNEEFIRKACALFGVGPEEILLEVNAGPQGEIDQEKLANFVAQAKDRLSSLSEVEAKNLVLALISASRRP
jgi:transcriptional regulator with XRE-family HTH domain